MHYIQLLILFYLLHTNNLVWAAEEQHHAMRWKHPIEVNNLSIEYYRYQKGFRDPYLVGNDGVPIQLRDGSALILDWSILGRIYWNNRFHMATDESARVRHAGWEFETGIHLWQIDLFRYHHSQHGLEYINPYGASFPVQDAFGIRLNLIGNGR